MNFNGLFDSKCRFELFKRNGIEILVPCGRMHFFNADCVGNAPNFQSVYICNNLLIRQIEFVDVNGFEQMTMDFDEETGTSE